MAGATQTTAAQVDPMAGKQTGRESSLSNWAGPYVTEMLGRGKALADQGYNAYQGPLTAGASDLQQQAFGGIANLANNAGNFNTQSFTDAGVSQQFMNPYVQSALNPQIDELRRQSDISREAQNSQLAKAGAFGGSRQAVMDAELDRNLQDQIAQTLNTGYMNAYNQGANQFNTEQNLGLQAAGQNFGQQAQGIGALMNAGQTQRDIEQQGIQADLAQFEQERMYPYKQVQFMQSLLQDMPLAAQSFNYAEPNKFNTFMSSSGNIMDFINDLTGGN